MCTQYVFYQTPFACSTLKPSCLFSMDQAQSTTVWNMKISILFCSLALMQILSLKQSKPETVWKVKSEKWVFQSRSLCNTEKIEKLGGIILRCQLDNIDFLPKKPQLSISICILYYLCPTIFGIFTWLPK